MHGPKARQSLGENQEECSGGKPMSQSPGKQCVWPRHVAICQCQGKQVEQKGPPAASTGEGDASGTGVKGKSMALRRRGGREGAPPVPMPLCANFRFDRQSLVSIRDINLPKLLAVHLLGLRKHNQRSFAHSCIAHHVLWGI